ncbi:MAG: Phenylalanine--tRNA ligase alpha subunit [Alphaproteobacteria bacterium MarineAlpha9_Bin2]|nr:MAG: Phenylalanine--tRNA ligase alpha subunit [Alphaproteobacteria bacterium MarineAlpha9_Bin2]
MVKNSENLEKEILKNIVSAKSLEELQNVRVAELGKKGRITFLMKKLSSLSSDEKKNHGAKLNDLRNKIVDSISRREKEIRDKIILDSINKEKLDISLSTRPGPNLKEGKIHPISRTIDEVISIFSTFGFSVETGPEIEDDYNNFTALNIPEDHPARQDHDTFYLSRSDNQKRKLLRTHTSPVQIRTMKNKKPPIRIIAPGRTFRCDDDATHSPMFHQVEGLAIEKNINMGHLKGLIEEFCRIFFDEEVLPIRFRPSYFPFTEPSAEVDIGCDKKDQKLSVGKGKDWLEVMGCGMVHPQVLINCKINPEEWQGFAFGLGVERFAMLKYGISDLRNFYEGDVRWLNHYGFYPCDKPSFTWSKVKEE